MLKKIRFTVGALSLTAILSATLTAQSAMADFSGKALNRTCEFLGTGDDPFCSMVITLLPSFYPTITLNTVTLIMEELSKTLSTEERRQIAAANVEASEILLRYEASTDTVIDQDPTPNFLQAKATLDSHLEQIKKEKNIEEITHLSVGQAASLIVSLQE